MPIGMDESSRSKAAFGTEHNVCAQGAHSGQSLASCTSPTSGVEGEGLVRERHIQQHRSSTSGPISNLVTSVPAQEPLMSDGTEGHTGNDRKPARKEHRAPCCDTPLDSVGDILAYDPCSRQCLASACQKTFGSENAVLAQRISSELRPCSPPTAHLESEGGIYAQSSYTEQHPRPLSDAMLGVESAIRAQNLPTAERLASSQVILRMEDASAQGCCIEQRLASPPKVATRTEGVVPSQHPYGEQPLSLPSKAAMSSGVEVPVQEPCQGQNTAEIQSGPSGDTDEGEEKRQESRSAAKRISQSSRRPERHERRRDVCPFHQTCTLRHFSEPRLSSPSSKPSKQPRTEAKLCIPETNSSRQHSCHQQLKARRSRAKDSFWSRRIALNAEQSACCRQSSRGSSIKNLGEQGTSKSSSSSDRGARCEGMLQTHSEHHHQSPSSGGRGELRGSGSEIPSTSRCSVRDGRMRRRQECHALRHALRWEYGPSGDELSELEELDRVGEFFYEVTVYLSPRSAGPPLRTVTMRRRSKPRPCARRTPATSPLKSPPRSESKCLGEPSGNNASAEQLNAPLGFLPSPLIPSQVEDEAAGLSSLVSESHIEATVGELDQQHPSPSRVLSVLPSGCTPASSEAAYLAPPKRAVQRASECPLCQQERTPPDVPGTNSIGATKPPGDAVFRVSSAPKHHRSYSAPATFGPTFPVVPPLPCTGEKRDPVIVVLPLRAPAAVEGMLPSLLQIDIPLKNISVEKVGYRTYFLIGRRGEAQTKKDHEVSDGAKLIPTQLVESDLSNSDPKGFDPCENNRGGQTTRVITASALGLSAAERTTDSVEVPEPHTGSEAQFAPPSVESSCIFASVSPFPFPVRHEDIPSFESDSITQPSTAFPASAEDCSPNFHHATNSDSAQGPSTSDIVVRTSATVPPEPLFNAESPSEATEPCTSPTASTDEIETNFHQVFCDGPKPVVDTEASTAAVPLQPSSLESPSATAGALPSVTGPVEVPSASFYREFGDESTQETPTLGVANETAVAILLKASAKSQP